jgi:sulfoxide reductase heme-binding subunit YedZ
MKQLYIFLAHHQNSIKKIFLLSYIAIISALVVGVWFYDTSPEIRSIYREIGEKSGQVSAYLLALTLIPGILKRLNILEKLESLSMLFRKQLGVLAFYTALMHLGYMSWIRMVAQGTNPLTSYFKFQQTGFAAFTIFLLLWVTSNNISHKLLGTFWRYLQRLSYLALIALILHIYDAESKTWIVLAVILGFEALSWLVSFARNKQSTALTKTTSRSQKKNGR